MSSCEMSFACMLGNDDNADTWFITSDGHVLPFHAVFLKVKGFVPSGLNDFVSAQVKAGQPRISVLFDSQTVWRILSFIYLDTYKDEDEDLTYPVVDPPHSPMAVTRLIDVTISDEETELSLGFRNLQVTPQACSSAVLHKAWANMLVYRAATIWGLDRLAVESSQRFDRFVSGSYNEQDFPEFVDAIFKSVSDPAQILYDHVVKECVVSANELIHNDLFLSVVQKNGLLGRLLFQKLTPILEHSFKSSGSNDQRSAPPGSSASTPSAPASSSTVSEPIIADLRSQLTRAQNDVALKDELLEGREADVLRLKETNARQHADLVRLQSKVFELAARPVAPRSENPDLAAQLSSKKKLVDKLSDQLDAQDHDLSELKTKLENSTRRTTELTREINQQRTGQRYNTDFMVQRNEARHQAEVLQSQLATSEDKVKDLEARLAAKEMELVNLRAAPASQPPPRSIAQSAPPSQPAPSVQGTGVPRSIVGFGALTNSVNSINAGTAVAPAPRHAPHSATLPPATTAGAAGGAMTFVQKLAARQAAAGITGGEPEEAPSSMSVIARDAPHATDQPSPTSSDAPLTNDVAAVTLPLTNDMPHGPHSNTPALRSVGLHAGAHSSQTNDVPSRTTDPHTASDAPHGSASARVHGVAQSAAVNGAPRAADPTTHALTVGQSNAGPDQRDGIIEQQLGEIARLQRQVTFLERQLRDARNGPTSNVNTRGHGGPSPPSSAEDSRRLKVILTALKEYDLDHKACLDCSINFNSEWRGIVDDIKNPALILSCKKCGEEKCRWRC